MTLKPTIRQVLEKPFDASLVKTRPGHFGQNLHYVEAPAYIRRLNEAFEGSWSFEICAHEVMEKEVLVVGKLTIGNGAIVKMAFGSSAVTRHSETGDILSLGDDLKAAATDALKKASSLWGIGLHLYEGNGNKPEPQEEPKAEKPANGTNGNGNGPQRLTAKQLAAIYAIANARNISKDDIQRLTVRKFERVPDFLTKAQASEVIQELQSA
ncbi:MAG: RAD52 family DNA repair protein [Deltaproteobacteria bacterium]|nr:RAD52 family DNA repair protein [Deltaproteobacteria bacterium]